MGDDQLRYTQRFNGTPCDPIPQGSVATGIHTSKLSKTHYLLNENNISDLHKQYNYKIFLIMIKYQILIFSNYLSVLSASHGHEYHLSLVHSGYTTGNDEFHSICRKHGNGGHMMFRHDEHLPGKVIGMRKIHGYKVFKAGFG